MPHVKDAWPNDADDNIPAATMPRADFFIATDAARQIEDAAESLRLSANGQEHAPPPNSEEIKVMAVKAPAKKRMPPPSYAQTIAPGAVAMTSSLINGAAVALIAFKIATAEGFYPCSALPEPLHTNICVFNPR